MSIHPLLLVKDFLTIVIISAEYKENPQGYGLNIHLLVIDRITLSCHMNIFATIYCKIIANIRHYAS